MPEEPKEMQDVEMEAPKEEVFGPEQDLGKVLMQMLGKDLVLKQDLVIPAGTVFSIAPTKTQRFGPGHVSAVFGLSPNTSGSVVYCINEPSDIAELRKYFAVNER